MLGKWIGAQRQARGWNQSELARRIGVKPNTINQWESGDRKHIGPAHLAALASVFEKTLDEVYAAAGLGPVPTLPGELTALLLEAQTVGVPRRLLQHYRRTYSDMSETEQQGVLEDLRDIIRQYRAAQMESGQRAPAQPVAHQMGTVGREPTIEAYTRSDSAMLLRRESAGGC